MAGYTKWYTHSRTKNMCNRRLAIKQRKDKAGHMTILDIQGWASDDQWDGYKGQMNNNTNTTKAQGI